MPKGPEAQRPPAQDSLSLLIRAKHLLLAPDPPSDMLHQVEQLLTYLILRTELHMYLGYEEPREILFEPGDCMLTPSARALLDACQQPPAEFIHRHLTGDWGQLSEEERQANEVAICQHLPVRSTYRTRNGASIVVLTAADRASTTIMVLGEA